MHLSLNKPSAIRCIAHQSRPPVRILVAINGELITDEFKYSTDIYEVPISHSSSSSHHNHNYNYNNRDTSNNHNGSDANYYKRYSLSHPSGLGFSIEPESLRTSYYDTYTNVTIEDISMRMQGQLVECFAYSFLTSNLSYRSLAEIDGLIKLNELRNDLMSTKSSIQVDCN